MYIILYILIICIFCYTQLYTEKFITNLPFIISIIYTQKKSIEIDNLLASLNKYNLIDNVVITYFTKKLVSSIKKWNTTMNYISDEKTGKYSILKILLKKYNKPVLHISSNTIISNPELNTSIQELCNDKSIDIVLQSTSRSFNNHINYNKISTNLILLNNTSNTFKFLEAINKYTHKKKYDELSAIKLINTNNKYNIRVFDTYQFPTTYRFDNNSNTIYKKYIPIIKQHYCDDSKQNKKLCLKKLNMWALPKKVVICFFGLTRSLKHNLIYLQKNIFDVLKQNGFDYDIFIHTYKKVGFHNNNWANESNILLDNNEYKLLNPTKYTIDDENIINKKLPFDFYKKQGDPWNNEFQAFHNYIKQLYSLYSVTKLWENNKNNYDSAIYIRPDVIVTKPLNIKNILKYEPNTIYIPDHSHHGGYNDRFAYGSINSMIIYGKRFEKGIEYSKNKLFHAETFLKYVLDLNKCNIVFDDMIVCRRRSNNKIDPDDILNMNLIDQITILTNK